MRLTLRAQIAIATGLVTMVIVALAGALIALRIDHRDRSEIDEQLSARAGRVVRDVGKLLVDGNNNDQPGDDTYGELLDGTESLVRILDGAHVVAQRGAIPDRPPPAPTTTGFSTVRVDGIPWRSYVLKVSDGNQLQVLQSLAPVNERRAANTQLVIVVTFLAAGFSGAAGWLVGSRVTRPLRRLTTGAVSIAEDPDPTRRLPVVERPAEIAALSKTLNGMLDRLGASTETTRRFAADVGHELRGPLTVSGSYLETLLAAPDISQEHMRESLQAIRDQQERMVSTLNALQVLARIDAGALPAPLDIEPGVLVEELVRLARHRHPDSTYTLADRSNGATVQGWPDGLRIAIDNLLDNAAVHGAPFGHVEVIVDADHTSVHVVIEDDGPGIPPDQRESLRERFTRGKNATNPGTGLGLALVDQQATLHNGKLNLSNAAAGGLRAELILPIANP